MSDEDQAIAKIRQFATDDDGVNMRKYQAVVDALDATLDIDPKTFPPQPWYTGKRYVGTEDHQQLLRDIRDHYVNKKGAIEAIAQGKPLTEKQFDSLAKYPVLDDAKFDEEHRVQYKLVLKDQPERDEDKAIAFISYMLSDAAYSLPASDRKAIVLVAKVGKLEEALALGQYNGVSKLEQNAREHGIKPTVIHDLFAEGKLEVIEPIASTRSEANPQPLVAHLNEAASQIARADNREEHESADIIAALRTAAEADTTGRIGQALSELAVPRSKWIDRTLGRGDGEIQL